MAKIYFYHGVMSSSKTAQLLMSDYEYRQKGMETILLKSNWDTRSKKIESRIGLNAPCIGFDPHHSILSILQELDLTKIKAILVDEAQLLSHHQTVELAMISERYNIDILCYGLLLTYKGGLFDGSKYLIEVGAKLQEIKSCGETRLTHHLRFVEGKAVFDGETIVAGKEEAYKAVGFKEFREEYKKSKGKEWGLIWKYI